MKILGLLLVTLFWASNILLALESDAPIAKDAEGVALDGYDMVSYFEGEGTEGSPEFSSQHRGAIWYFSSAENRAKFEANPEQYMPEFGGYCTYAVSKEKATKGAGKYARLQDGKLYFSAGYFIQKIYNFNTEYYNEKAGENWGKVKEAIASAASK